MSDIASFQPIRALDRDGIPAPGALAYFFQSGTTTPQAVYSDEALSVAHPSPLEADSQGVFPPVFSDVALRCTVTDASGTTLPGFPIDPVLTSSTGSGASQVSFVPTGSIPETNVQAAIERVQANLVAPLLAGGIGVTGNAPVLSNIDATNTASGAYRFDNTSTGTFPSGVTAAGGGTIRLWRETAAEAVMMLNPRNSDSQWLRTLSGGVWGGWSRVGTGASATGISLLQAASAAAARTTLGTPAQPQTGAGVGQVASLFASTNTAIVLPAGGTWFYFAFLQSDTTGVISPGGLGCSIAAGGASVLGPVPGASGYGFAWRLT